jgi:thiol-disulfide isomerase/thioredoxin
MHRLALVLIASSLLLLAGWLGQPAAPAQTPAAAAVELKVVKYADLIAAVRAQVGKVVVVDIWGEFCIPCKKEFPHLVDLHRRLADKGLVCMSVTIDPNEPQKQAAALKFLQKVGATFPNFLLDENQKVWQSKWDITAVPAVFVFDRKGRRVAKFDNEDTDKPEPFTYQKDIEPLVEKLVNER